MTQKDPDGKERLIGASSRLFHKAEKSYSVFKKEIISVMTGLDTFKQLLSFAKIHLTIDARAILFMRSCKGTDPLIERFSKSDLLSFFFFWEKTENDTTNIIRNK